MATQVNTNQIKDASVTDAKLATAKANASVTITAGSGLSGGGDLSANRTLDVNVDGSTIEINSDTLRVKAGGIGANELASTTVTPATYTNATVTVDADGRITSASSGSAGSGTVSTGTANTLAYYPSSTNTVDDLAAITASRLLVSDSNGLPVANTSLTSGQNVVASGTGAVVSGATMSMNNTKITSLANGTASTDAAAFGQIYYGFQAAVQGTTTSPTGTTSATYTATGLSASMTMTNSAHRIRVTASCGMLRNTRPDLSRGFLTLFRDSSNLGATNGMTGNSTGALASTIDTGCTISWIDSPGDTNAHTYAIYVKSADSASSTVTFNVQSQTTSIILEEIV